jgi:hypothetical protein
MDPVIYRSPSRALAIGMLTPSNLICNFLHLPPKHTLFNQANHDSKSTLVSLRPLVDHGDLGPHRCRRPAVQLGFVSRTGQFIMQRNRRGVREKLVFLLATLPPDHVATGTFWSFAWEREDGSAVLNTETTAIALSRRCRKPFHAPDHDLMAR